MDISPLNHALLAVGAQLVIWRVLRSRVSNALWIGAAFGMAFYWGREVAQAEKRWDLAWGEWYWWRGFDITYWNTDSVLDLVFPVVACVLVVFVAHRWARPKKLLGLAPGSQRD